MNKILWIASYPKSGNTFVRSILSSLIYTDDGKFDFELLRKIPLLDTATFYNFIKDIDIDDFNNLENIKISSKYWEMVQKKFQEKTSSFIFKTHAANLMFENRAYTNKDRSLGLIYLIRDPRDIPLSYSYHQEKSVSSVINDMLNIQNSIKDPKDKISVPIASWDVHVKSWEMLNVPKLFIKYEELIDNTMAVLNNIINFLNKLGIQFSINDFKLQNIINSTKFENLKINEQKKGFPVGITKNFFREGRYNKGSDLNKNDYNKIVHGFNQTMKKYGYI